MNAPMNPSTGKPSDPKLFDLSGQVAIVTGTSRGLGQYFARALAKAGADLVITSRKRETLAEFAAEIEALGRRVLSLDLDVRNEESIRRMAADAEAAFDSLVHRGIPAERIILLGHSLGSGPAVALATRHRAAALVLFGAFTSIPDAAAERYPWLPVRYVASVQFDSLARMPLVHIPVVIAHSRADTTIPYSHALKLYAAAPEPKRLLIFDTSSQDGFGGHVDALFDNVHSLEAALSAVLPRPLAAVNR